MRKPIILFFLLSILTACEQKVVITLPQNSSEQLDKSANATKKSSEAGQVFTASQLVELPVQTGKPENMSKADEYAHWEETLSKQAGYQEAKRKCEANNKKYKLKLEKSSTLLSTSTSVRFECE